jgi:hypothetical protein
MSSYELTVLSFVENFNGPSYPVYSISNITYDNSSIPIGSSRQIAVSAYSIGVQLGGVSYGAVSPSGGRQMLLQSGWGSGNLVFNFTPDVVSNLRYYTVRAVAARGFSNDYDVNGIVMHFVNLTNHIRIFWWSNPPRSNANGALRVWKTGDPSYGSSLRSVVALQQHGVFWTLTATTARAADGRSVELYVQLLDQCGNNVLDNSDKALIQGSIWRVGTLGAGTPEAGAFGTYGSVNAGGLFF